MLCKLNIYEDIGHVLGPATSEYSKTDYFLKSTGNRLKTPLILPSMPLLFFSFSSIGLKHSGHNARKFIGLLSFNEPLMCSNCGGTLGLNFTLHFWQRLRARSSTVCLMASVMCSYFFLSKLGPPLGAPKMDTRRVGASSNLCFAITISWCFLQQHRRGPSDRARKVNSFFQ